MSAFLEWRQCVCLFLILITMLFLSDCVAVNNSNERGIAPGDNLGEIVPQAINLEEGNSLEMFCNLNLQDERAKGHNASDLFFLRDMVPVRKEFVEIVNETTIRLFESEPPASNAMYVCSLHTNNTLTGVFLTRVIIGYKPREVLNFTCISNNWENLTCKWTKPENPLVTKYKLHFKLPGRAGARMSYGCSGSDTEKMLQRELKSKEDLCYWSLSTTPLYRLPYEYYYFKMKGENALDTVEFPWIKFHHYGHVIPAQPENLHFVNITHNSVLLKWSASSHLQNFSPGLSHRVEYQSIWDKNEWHSVDTSQLNVKHHTNYTFNFTGLQYANTPYDIRVYIKSAVAVGNDKWSKPATLTIKTKPTIPGAAPRTDVGSFEELVGNSLRSRDVYVYWQHIPEYLKNGDNFHYKVVSVRENGIFERYPNITPVEMTNAYAKFKGLSEGSYNFTIVASNSEGDSGPTYVYLPPKKNMPPEPSGVTKIAYSPSLYELSWKFPPEREHLIESYTIFWCNNVRDRPFQCPGFLNWTHVPKGETVKNLTVPVNEIYQFAVSANTKYSSSGMIWASCTVIHNKSTGKMKSVWINKVGSDFIEVGWKFECSDRIGRVEKFYIKYCPILFPGNNATCKETESFLEASPTQIHNNITGLLAYTTYIVSVVIETNSGVRQRSEPVYGTTLEGPPEPPRNVKVSNVTNTSMIVSWIPPLLKNGVITLYKVCYGEPPVCNNVDSNSTLYDNQSTIKVENMTNSRHFSFKVENMSSYENYRVSVQACTTKCSEHSSYVPVKTRVGAPGVMERPKISFMNSSQIEVSWKRPLSAGGVINLYQVAIHQTDGETNRSNYYNSTTNKTQIPVCDIDGFLHEKYAIMVRAVNMDKQNKVYFGPWSESTEYSCYGPSLSKPFRTAIVVFGVVLMTVIAVCLWFAGKRFWLYCKEMQDLVPKLPPGLAPTCEKEKDPDFHIEVAWPSDIHDHQVTGKLLLDDNEVHRLPNSSGDSSGCSSGHESVSSSLTAGTHISSDSGTEADQRPPSPDGVFLTTPWDRTSLRQRNINPLRPVKETYVKLGKGSGSVARSTPNLTDADNVSVGATGPAYSCLGAWSLLDYGSMPNSEDVDSSGGGEDIGYCRVGLDATSLHGISNENQFIPSKGYVVLSNLSASTPHLIPQPESISRLDTSPQARGYVSHQILRPSPVTNAKLNETDKGYVMAGEHNKIISPPSEEELEDEDHGFMDIESFDEDSESYCRFGVQALQMSDDIVIEECDVTKPSSGYVTLGDNSQPSDREVASGTNNGVRTVGTSGGYVPHRHFEKRDTASLDANLMADCLDESYSNVTPLSTGDSNINSSKVNV